MIFHEIYGCYYQAVGRILALASEGSLTEADMKRICDETAFSESFLTILPALKSQQWQLVYEGNEGVFKTPIKCRPDSMDMPLTLLEKRWLKAITMDARFRLFLPDRAPSAGCNGEGDSMDAGDDLATSANDLMANVDLSFLEGVEPLFTPDDFVLFDQYGDGDPYREPGYVKIFRCLCQAIHQHRKVEILYPDRKGRKMWLRGWPYELEYSEKDDKFRVLLSGTRKADVLNVGKILSCSMIEEQDGTLSATRKFGNRPLHPKPVNGNSWFVLELVDERNALERVMLHFAHFRKEAEQLDHNRYRVKIYYQKVDVSELVIRVLSFGPMVKVTEPMEFVELVREKLRKQMKVL